MCTTKCHYWIIPITFRLVIICYRVVLLLIYRWPLWIQMLYTGTLYYVVLSVYLANKKLFKWIATLTTPASNKFQSMSHLTKAETTSIEHRETMKDDHTGKRIKAEQRPVVITNTSKDSNGYLTFNQGKYSETWPSDHLCWMTIPVL